MNFETTWREFISWDGIPRSSNISTVPLLFIILFHARPTNSRYFFNSIPSNSIGSSSVFVIRCFFSLVIFVTAFSIFCWANLAQQTDDSKAYLYMDLRKSLFSLKHVPLNCIFLVTSKITAVSQNCQCCNSKRRIGSNNLRFSLICTKY